MRKFWLTMAGILSFTLVMLLSKGTINPFNLGLGIGFLISPMAVSNSFEHKYSNQN